MPSILTIMWSMCASACFMLGFIHLFFWFKSKEGNLYFLSAIMAISAGVSAWLELALLVTTSIDIYNELLRYENVAIFMILVPMIWFVQLYLKTGRSWLAVTITILWSLGIIANFLSQNNLTFTEIYELKQVSIFWGETFSIPSGEENPWKILADIASLLILFYVMDASIKKFNQGNRNKALIIGGSIIFFILFAGIHTPLVDAEIITMPYMISFGFLVIIVAFSYQLASDAMLARQYAHQIVTSEDKRAVTEQQLRQTQSELEHMARANLLGELSTTLAHEINQPLSAIMNNSNAAKRFLSSETPNLQEIAEIIEDIIRDDKRANEIIVRLGSLLQKSKSKHEPFAINDIIQEVIDFLKYEISTHHIVLKLKPHPDNPIVIVDKIEIQQVFINLIYNAIKAMSDVPESNRFITITTKITNEKKIIVSVSDTGKGISEVEQKKIFDAFYTSDQKNNLGMGLTISYRIIKAYGGEIKVNNSPHGGAIFSVNLPLQTLS